MADALRLRSVAVMPIEHPVLVVQVRCGPHGEWFIQEGQGGDPLSWHDNETAAEAAAIDHVRHRGGGHVYVRDRYHRVRSSDRAVRAR